ncbi:zinc finger BED domain-containing protein RICESLEEPER 2-like [Zingiber officinale]|uniref:zinc finger BED domain-containing protein RICESLEEPER 2-like n=1 Tax=Zingiber officinale TaxID=94328 RepID=UPI001C4B4254|nr:zinc finger BED domain-containing protein RICESLEEPER 2-like [Zingiber officinale]
MASQPIDLDQEEDSEEEEPEGAPAVSMTTRDLNVDEETSSQGKASGSGKRKRLLKSKWWQYFEILPKLEGEDLRCKCKACGITYKAESSMGTGNLRRHILNQCLKQKTSDIAQALLEQGDKSLAIRSQRFNQERFRELLILAIVKHDLPFQFVEYEAIRSIFTYLEPQVNYFTRNTARTDILKMHKNECNRIAQEMHSCPGKICFTSDLWTSIATDGYICLTAHFIDSNWVLQKRIINFSYMPPPHSGIALCDKINSLFNVWGIQRKVFTITLDNAAANDVFVGLLRDQLGLNCSLVSGGEFLHVRCCAHILNLIVQEGLKRIDSSVDKIREYVKYVKGSQVRKQKYIESVTQTSLDSKKSLRQDVPTRWNSTYLMLSSAMYYRRAFNHLRLANTNFTHCPSVDEWGQVEKIFKFLEVFYETTTLFSGVKYPTANLYFPRIFTVQLTISQALQSSDDFMRSMANRMFHKFDKYWKDYNILFAIAVIVDPRFKMQFVEFCYNKLYGHGSNELSLVRSKLVSLFEEYMHMGIASKVSTSSASSSSHSAIDDNASLALNLGSGCMDVLKEFDTFQSLEFIGRAQKSQLELYLEEPTIDRITKLDILGFWKAHQFRYPDLAQMARDILSVPISTVASESAFSTGGRILDQYRSAMKPDVVEALVCCRDWLAGGKETTEVGLNDLTENIMNLFTNEDTGSKPTATHD